MAQAGLTGAPRPSIALLPWGDVIEDFLDPLGVTLEAYRDEMTGGWTYGYVEALQLRGVDTAIVCVSARVERPVRWRHKDTGAPIWLLPATRGFRALRNARPRRVARRLTPFLATPLGALAGVLRHERCAAVVCQEYEHPRFDACVGLGRRMGLPVFATFQGGDRRGSVLEAPLRPLAVRASAGLIVGPAREAERVARRYRLPASRIARISNPLDVREWTPGPGEAARAELGLAADDRVVAWHGRVDVRQKGLDVLLEAWRALTPEPGRRRRLLLVGTGRDAPELRRRIADAGVDGVHWVDEYLLDRDRLRALLRAGDLYVFPSRHEGFPVAPIEAMALGLPVVAADAPGLREIVGEGPGAAGVVVPREDPSALAAAIDGVLADEAGRRRMAEAARRRAVETFSLEAVGERLLDFLTARGARLGPPPG